MRYFRGFLIAVLLLPASSAHALELFGDFLYWKATEPVDWVLNTNNSSSNQYVNYQTLTYDFAPGFRVGAAQTNEAGGIDAKFYYTNFQTSTTDTAIGDLTGGFLGAKSGGPPWPIVFFDTGQVQAEIDYHMFDADVGLRFEFFDTLQIRPLVGLRGGWINQNFNSQFQANYPGLFGQVQQDFAEYMTNDFWGIGPKLGVESSFNVVRGEAFEFNWVASFSTAYLLGHWSIIDVSINNNTELGVTTTTTHFVQVPSRDFGVVTFQALVGFNMRLGSLTATVGYEISDWFNMCQIFTDATGPQNNDLLLQGLTANVGVSF